MMLHLRRIYTHAMLDRLDGLTGWVLTIPVAWHKVLPRLWPTGGSGSELFNLSSPRCPVTARCPVLRKLRIEGIVIGGSL